MKYISDLHQKGTESFINSRCDQTLKLGKNDTEETKRLFWMLNNFHSRQGDFEANPPIQTANNQTKSFSVSSQPNENRVSQSNTSRFKGAPNKLPKLM